ncbi:MAG: hypothetical protein Ct9H300mP1_03730 [Planctomycetaceae bacterium]|nr:MAG: hypothetical protein Ct9H300mP1_03730 [Planctomycetaceae bacterium]
MPRSRHLPPDVGQPTVRSHSKLAPPREDRDQVRAGFSEFPTTENSREKAVDDRTNHQGAAELGIGADQLIRDPQPMTQLGGAGLSVMNMSGPRSTR